MQRRLCSYLGNPLPSVKSEDLRGLYFKTLDVAVRGIARHKMRSELTPSVAGHMFVEQTDQAHPSYESGDYDTDAENSTHRESGEVRERPPHSGWLFGFSD